MNIYSIVRTDTVHRDEVRAMVVRARTDVDALNLAAEHNGDEEAFTWVSAAVRVTLLGIATDDTAGLVMQDVFNA